MNATFRSLGIRNYRLYLGGQTISQGGTWMRLVALSLLVLHLTDDGVAVGIVAACQFLPVLLLGAWSGLLADRTDKRRLLLTVQVGLMAHSWLLALLAAMDDPPLLALYGVAFIGGVGTALDNPARRSFVVELVPPSYLSNAVSLNTALMTGSRVFGPALAGLLIGTVGFAWCFVVDALSYLAVLWGLWRMDVSDLRPPPLIVRGKGQVREGLRYVRAVPTLWVSLMMVAIVGTLAFNFPVVLPLFVTRALDGSDAEFTILFSVLSVGSTIGALWQARRTSVAMPQVITGAGLFGVAMLVLAVAPGLAAAYVSAVLVGAASVAFITGATTLIQLRADPGMRGRVVALQGMVLLGSTPIGGPVLGVVAEVFGARAGVGLGGVACLLAAAVGLLAARRCIGDDVLVAGEPTTPADFQPA